MGVTNTVACLDAQVAPAWHDTVHALRPGLSYLALYLGFDGDIAAAGATAANVWIYESEDIGRVWRAPADEDAPGLFVSFPSLKDPANQGKHTAEVVALCDAQAFGPWLHLACGRTTGRVSGAQGLGRRTDAGAVSAPLSGAGTDAEVS